MKQKKRKWSDLSEADINEMKDLFKGYHSITSISDKFNIPRTTLSYHIENDGWSTDREMQRAELYTRWAASKKGMFIGMSDNAAKIIQKSLNHLANRQEPPTPREAKDAVAILESLDKITRLDDGRPTEITEEKVMELRDIEVIAEMVPFKSKPKLVEEDSEEEDEKVN